MSCSKVLEKIQKVSLPVWPEKETLKFKHQELLQEYLSCYPSLISEFSFSGLFLFKEQYHYSLTSIEKHLYILGKDKKQNRQFIHILHKVPSVSFLYNFFSQDSYIKILPLSLQHTMKRSLLLLESWNLHAKIIEERGDFDYLYHTRDLAKLQGIKFHKKRNHLNYFKEHYQYVTKTITSDHTSDVYRVLNTLKQQSYADYEAIKNVILHFEKLPLFGRITYVDDVPVAFVIAEYRNNQKVVIVHFEKADIRYRGLYQYINQEFATQLPDHCSLINREQDLGEEGLRKAKQTYRPIMLLKKYRVYPHSK